MTTKTLEGIKSLHEEGLVGREIAERLGVSMSLVQYWRTKEGLAANRSSRKYTVYERATSAFVVEGTVEKCSKFLGVKPNTFRGYACRFKRDMIGRYEIYEVTA